MQVTGSPPVSVVYQLFSCHGYNSMSDGPNRPSINEKERLGRTESLTLAPSVETAVMYSLPRKGQEGQASFVRKKKIKRGHNLCSSK